jgi:alcohol dehydrogenase
MTDEISLPPAATTEPATVVLPLPEEAPWDAQVNRTWVLFGAGRLADLGHLVSGLGGKRILLITDIGLVQAGHAGQAEKVLRKESLDVVVYDGVEENPTTAHVERGAALARDGKVDFLVGLGGGSSMDCAKGINFILTNGGVMEDYRGTNLAKRPMLPSVGVPTTAGTGSEAQAYALIARAEDKDKMACGDDKARFRAVILDPGLLASVPRMVAAVAGMDAVAHAVESYVSRPADHLARAYAGEAWRLLSAGLVESFGTGASDDARAAVLWGAHLAGAGIDRAMLGAAHACANPLTARFGVSHGVAVALMLPHVVRFNGQEISGSYGELQTRALLADTSVEGLARRIEELRGICGLPATLAEAGVDTTDLPDLSEEAARQWTAGFNPRPVSAGDLLSLYRMAAAG